MKLSEEQKDRYFDKLWGITVKSYSSIQTPSMEEFRRVINAGDVFVVEWYMEIVGYALVSPYPVPLLRSIAVESSARKNGFGTSLLEEIDGYYRSKGFSRIVLHVMVHNPAQKLYFDNGYRVTKVLKNYYPPEGDGLEMEKIL